MILTEEQKEQAIQEFAHYLLMDTYDFALSIGGWDVYAGELARPLTDMFEEELKEEYNDEKQENN